MGDTPAIMEMDSVADDAVVEHTHIVSWFWLLLPTILTTAFIIVGAWRRAVQDADELTTEPDTKRVDL